MNPEAQEYLEKILEKNPDTLTKDEIVFLRARRSYLKASQLEEYESVLETKPPTKEPVKKNAKAPKAK